MAYPSTRRWAAVATVATALSGSASGSERQTAFLNAWAARRANPGVAGSVGFDATGGSCDSISPRRPRGVRS